MLKTATYAASSVFLSATVKTAMIAQRYLHTFCCLIVSSLFLVLASCADESVVDFASMEPEVDESRAEFTICADNSVFEDERPLTTADLVGKYVKTRELVCGVAGCEEAPFVNVQFVGFSPSFEMFDDGGFLNPDGPFERFDHWMLDSGSDTDRPNRIILRDEESPDNDYQVTILDAGKCRLRIENVQGWIEYSRLNEV